MVSETIINAVTVVSDQISSPLISETIVGVASVAATCLPLINMDMLSISQIAEVYPAFIPNTLLFHETFYSFDLESLLIKGKESLPWLNEEDPALIYNFTILDNFISQYVYSPNTVVKFVANVLYKTFLVYNIDFTSFIPFYQNCLIHLKELSLKADPTSIGIPNILDLNLREVQTSLKFKLNELLLGLFFGMFFKIEAFFSVFLEPRYNLIHGYFLHQLIDFDLKKDLTKIVKFKRGQMTIKCGQKY